ncbi:MAG: methylenetetrahydrofolate reductase [Gammaproteobacteria bacterium]|nr:methylenetetrahydrofolate reductase [Gammaproteobacteria bacterium]
MGRLLCRSMNTTVADFVRKASTEISTHDENLLEPLRNALPAGTALYVAHTPKAKLQDVVRVAVKAQSLGFRASPHIVARRITSEVALARALETLREGGVRQVLLVAGDLQRPVGDFTSTLQILDTGLLESSGIEQVGVAGHPDGHPSINADALLTALRHKQDFAVRTGMRVHIVTQFGFDPEGICAWDERMTEQGITLPVHVGIPGPTPVAKLVKFALQCGVGASLSSLMKNVGSMANLARLATTPDEMLLGLIRGRAVHHGSRLVQPHFYAFGGTMATAAWLRAVADGSFTVDPDGRKFVVNA